MAPRHRRVQAEQAPARKKRAQAPKASAAVRKTLSCTHASWELVDPCNRRYRCTNCSAMGFRRMGAARGVRLYRCKARIAGKMCKRPGVQRGWVGLVEAFFCFDHTGHADPR